MSDSTDTTPAVEVTTWTQGMHTALVGHAEKAGAQMVKHLRRGDLEAQAACLLAEKVYRLYLKGEKARVTLYFGEHGPLGSRSIDTVTAYRWVAAGRVLRVFGDDLKQYQADDPIGVNALALYDRYTASAETQTVGREAITREAVTAATEGRKPFSAVGVQATVTPPKPNEDGTEVSPEEAKAQKADKRVGNIATKLTDPFADGYRAFQVAMAKAMGIPVAQLRGMGVGTFGLEAYTASTKLGATWGSANGGTTGLAIDRVEETFSALANAKAVKALKDQKDLDVAIAAIDQLRPEPSEETAETPTPTRSQRGKKATETPAVA